MSILFCVFHNVLFSNGSMTSFGRETRPIHRDALAALGCNLGVADNECELLNGSTVLDRERFARAQKRQAKQNNRRSSHRDR